MASVSTKTTELKKSPTGKAILSPSNGTAEKSPKATVLKSPSTKVSPKSTLIKNGNDSGKTNGSVTRKMDTTTSPPKVVRSSSAKSITPPNKTVKTSPVKTSPEQSNSQGDTGNNLAVKNEPVVDNGVVHSDSNCDVIPIESKLRENHSALDSATPVAEKDADVETSLKKDLVEMQDNAILSVTLDDHIVKGNSALVKDKPPLTTEQNLASGDKALTIEKPEMKDSAGESIAKELVERNDGTAVSSAAKSDAEPGDEAKAEISSAPTLDESKTTEKTEPQTDSATESKSENNVEEPSIPKAEDSPTLAQKISLNSSGTDCTECSAETAKLPDEPEISKQSFRLKVWDHLDKNDLVVFPRPCKGRIPNFKGAPAAAEKLTTLDVFKKSKTIKVNPDKPQEMVRYHTLEYGKRLLVPVPRLREGLFQAVIPPSEASKYQLQQASQRYGMKKWSKPIGSDDKVSIDLVVLGSVVVDRKGHRIGKGEGFADLEFAMLVKMNAVNENTVIVTTVHDDQVYDELPDYLFKEHDVPVDWIITPTQVIEVKEKLQRPTGLIWSILSNRRILEIPILQKLRDEEISEGHECTLKEVDSDTEEKPFVPRFVRNRRYFNYSQSTGDPVRDSKLFASGPYYHRPRRYFQSNPPNNRVNNYGPPMRDDGPPPPRRGYYQEPYEARPERMGPRPARERRPRYTSGSNEPPMDRPQSLNRPRSQNRPKSTNRSRSMNQTNGPRNQKNNPADDLHPPMAYMSKSVEVQTVDKKTRAKRALAKRKKAPVEFSLRVKNIGVGARVRDLKVALSERGVKPRDITWRGYKGFAFLHFVKPAAKENVKPLSVDEVVQTLQGLVLPQKDEQCLIFEPMQQKNADNGASDVQSEIQVQEENVGETTSVAATA